LIPAVDDVQGMTSVTNCSDMSEKVLLVWIYSVKRCLFDDELRKSLWFRNVCEYYCCHL